MYTKEQLVEIAARDLLHLMSPIDWSYMFGHPKYGDISFRIIQALERLEKAVYPVVITSSHQDT